MIPLARVTPIASAMMTYLRAIAHPTLAHPTVAPATTSAHVIRLLVNRLAIPMAMSAILIRAAITSPIVTTNANAMMIAET